MKIKIFTLDGDNKTMVFEMNEAYFRFTYNEYLRFDCQGDNYEEGLSKEQKTLIDKISYLGRKGESVFKKILFYENEIRITLLEVWEEDLIKKAENSIKESWPIFFMNTV